MTNKTQNKMKKIRYSKPPYEHWTEDQLIWKQSNGCIINLDVPGEIILDVQGELESAFVVGPFDKAKSKLESQGYKIISLEEDAMLRIQEGKISSIYSRSNYVKDGMIYVPSSKEVYWTRNSPIMEDAEEATKCHRDHYHFPISEEQTEIALKNAVKFHRRDKESNFEVYTIPTNRFAEDEITSFAYGKYAKDFGRLLKDKGVKEEDIRFEGWNEASIGYKFGVGHFSKPFAVQMHSHSLCGNVLDYVPSGEGYHLDFSRFRGVRKKQDVKV